MVILIQIVFRLLFVCLCYLFIFQLNVQIEDGDIICFQKVPNIQSEEEYRYPDVPSYLEYVKNRQVG